MSTVEEAASRSDEEVEERVAPLELFFDLVFVFAITQVTTLMSEHPTWEGLGAGDARARRDLVGLGRLLVDDQRARHGDEGLVRVSMLRGDGDDARGGTGPSQCAFGDNGVGWFGVAFLIVRLLHLVVYGAGDRHGDQVLIAQIKRFARPPWIGPVLIIVAVSDRRHGGARAHLARWPLLLSTMPAPCFAGGRAAGASPPGTSSNASACW